MPEWTGPTIEIVDWKRFQHYTKRNPPWIRLYTHLLDDENWFALSSASKALAIELWMLASRKNNLIPLDERWLKSRMPEYKRSNLMILQQDGWIKIHDASNMLASCKQSATSETETETETETESCRKATPPPDGAETVSGDLKSRRNGILIYYLKAFRKSRYDLTLPRKRILDEALQNFDDETIRQTIDLFATHKAYAFHRGETESSNGRKYTGLCEYILAKGSKVSITTRIQEILETGGYEVVDDES